MLENKFYELTNPQTNIWNTEAYFSGTNINNITTSCFLNEEINIDILKKAINIFVEYHDSFRIHLSIVDGRSMQFFEDFKPFDIDVFYVDSRLDFSKMGEELANEKFELFDSNLFKFKIVKFPDGKGGILLSVHHIISDSWSLGITAQEVIKIYHSLLSGTFDYELNAFSYKDIISSEKSYIDSNRYKKDKEFWNSYLQDFSESVSIPSINKKLSANSSKAERISFDIDGELVKQISDFCNSNKISNYSFFMSIFSLYIANVANVDDLILGTPILNRLDHKDKLTTGMFVTTIPFRVSFSENDTFVNFVLKNNINLVSLYRHQKYPYSSILEDVRANADIPNLYNVAFSYQITKGVSRDIGDYEIEWIFNHQCLNDINIHLYDFNDTGKLRINYDYLIDKYSKEEISLIHYRIINMIKQIFNNPSIMLDEIEIVTPDEKNQILNVFNGRKLDYPSDKTVIQLFENQVLNNANNTALIYKDNKYTYKNLNSIVNRFARFLQTKGVSKNDIVGVYMNKNSWFIISILAIQKLGAAYLPMHPEYPKDRVEYILKDSNSKLLITDQSISLDLPIINNLDSLNLDNFDDSNLNIEFSNNSLCYVIYTSGSTGNPKGVMLSHSNLVNYLHCVYDAFDNKISSQDNCLTVANISFDANVMETFTPLLSGATLVIYPDNTLTDIHIFCDMIEKYHITFTFVPPSLLPDIYNFVKSNNYKFYADKLMVGVESLKNSDLNDFLSLNKDMYIMNGYGPTETTICITFFKYIYNSDESGYVPIGYPLKNNDVLVLNRFNNLQPIGCPGEICVTGNNVSQGYLNNPEKTEESFVKIPKFENKLFYKTGDISYWHKDGYLIFVGRKDFQIKYRGHRIELNEINNCIKNINGIKNSVTLFKTINNIPCICCYISSSDSTITSDYIKKSLDDKLPYYMIPRHIMILDDLPINKSGKIDKSKLPEIIVSSSEFFEAETKTQKILSNIVCQLLNLDKVSIKDSFVDLGMDSLLAIRFSVEVFNSLKTNISLSDIFKYNSIELLSEYVETLSIEDNLNLIPVCANSEFYPLSSAQRRIYYTSKMIGENNLVYNVPGAILIDKILDKDKVEKCFKEIIKNQSVFRTSFVLDGDTIKQKISDTVDFKVQSYAAISTEMNEIIQKFPKPFDLSTAPLLRVELYYLDYAKTLLLLDSNHIVMDGSSLEILIKDFCKLYNGENLDILEIEYKDFAVWENKSIDSNKFKKAEDYWINKFKDSEIPSINLPYDFSIPSKRTYEGTTISKEISYTLFDNCINYAKKLGVSPYMFFISTFFVLLYKYTGQNEIFLGSPTFGRDNYQLKDLIGMFVNNIVVKADIDSNEKFTELLSKIKNEILEDLTYQDYPYDLLVKKLNIPTDNSSNPLFDVMFIYQNTGNKKINLGDASIDIIRSTPKISKFNLSFEIDPNTKTVTLEYRTDLFKKETIEALFEHYINTLNSVLNNQDILIKDISILSENEKNNILKGFNNTNFKYDSNKHIHTLFEEQVLKTPDDVALVFENQELTYKDLNEKANAISYYLKNHGFKANDIVGIMLPRSLELIIAMLGVLKSGACYIPIDPTYPQKRIEYMLENSNAKILLTNNDLYNKINFKNKLSMDLNCIELYSLNTNNLNCDISPNDSSYIIYTSGSTGLPKGVVLRHQSLTNLCNYLNDTVDFLKDSSKYKNMVSVTTASFDIFIFETLICLQKGLKVILANENEQRIPALLDNLIKNNNVQLIQMTPSRMQFLVDNIADIPSLSNLKYVVLAGEPLPLKLKNELLSLGIKKVYNGYGPSETTVFSTFTNVTEQDFINIGKPLYNTQMYIVDKDLNPVPVGIAGELYISGDGVGKGYLNRPDITSERFITNPFNPSLRMYKTGDLCKFDSNGELYYLERADNQVKVRGLRIELGEIENKILEFPFVEKAKVVKQVIDNREVISAYIVSSKEIEISDLRDYLANRLPNYMVPAYFTKLDDFPYTPNGKIDKNALPLPTLNYESNFHEYVAPQNDLERDLVNIWEKVLGSTHIGINDNFFELGGDSISAIRFQMEAMNLGLNITYSDIFSFPTPKKLAERAQSSHKEIFEVDTNYDFSKIDDLLSKNTISNIDNSKINFYYDMGNILLIGSTGFLGSHILDKFLSTQKGIAYCLIRSKSSMEPADRLKDTLNFYFGDKYNDEFGKRIIVINGDITDKNLKLENCSYNDLGKNVNTVIHSAALVKHYGSFEQFNNINVLGTKNIIEFCKNFNKKLYFISTLSVSGGKLSDNENENIAHFKETDFYIGQELNNIYIYTKFKAEKLIYEEILNGLSACVIRVGNITNRYSDGKFQINASENAFVNRIKSILKLGVIQDKYLTHSLEFTPVDLCADAIIKIISSNPIFTVFHLFNNNTITSASLLRFLNILGVELKTVSDEEFSNVINKFLSDDMLKNQISGIVTDLDKDKLLHLITNVLPNSEFTQTYLNLLGFNWPNIDFEYVEKYLKYFNDINYFD